ncbi:MAG: methyltransferase domain-containing protein [Candidatus Zixiibacteriota bacterium]
MNIYDDSYYMTLKEEYMSDSAWKKNRIANVMKLLSGLEVRNASILDIACGIGTFTIELHKKKLFAIGLDNSLNAITVSSRLFKDITLAKGSFIASDALSLPFVARSFDILICADFIEHITSKDYERLIEECWRILKPRGYILIYTPNKWHFLELMMRYNIILKKDESHIDIKTMSKTLLPLKEAGFHIMKHYYRPTHIKLLKGFEYLLMHVPFVGELFRRRICVLAQKPQV